MQIFFIIILIIVTVAALLFALKKQIDIYIASYFLTAHHIDPSDGEVREATEFVIRNMLKDARKSLKL